MPQTPDQLQSTKFEKPMTISPEQSSQEIARVRAMKMEKARKAQEEAETLRREEQDVTESALRNIRNAIMGEKAQIASKAAMEIPADALEKARMAIQLEEARRSAVSETGKSLASSPGDIEVRPGQSAPQAALEAFEESDVDVAFGGITKPDTKDYAARLRTQMAMRRTQGERALGKVTEEDVDTAFGNITTPDQRSN